MQNYLISLKKTQKMTALAAHKPMNSTGFNLVLMNASNMGFDIDAASNYSCWNGNKSCHNTDGMETITGPNAHRDINEMRIIELMNSSQFQILMPSLILVCVLLILGIPGNLIAVLVYMTKMKWSTASYFIITLAMSDLINCAVSLPIEIYIITNFWTFDHPVLCKFSRFLTLAMNNTSSFILVAIAVERCRSICTPLKPRFSSLCTKVVCGCIVVAAIVTALPMIWGYGTFTYPVTIGNVTAVGKTCLISDEVLHTSYPKMLLIFYFTGHLTIFTILAILYICIARKLVCGYGFQENAELSKSSQNILLQRQPSTYSVVSFSARPTSLKVPVDNEKSQALTRKISKSSVSSQSNIEMNSTRRHGGHHFRTRRLTCMLFLVTSVFEISFIPYLVIVCLRNEHPNLYASLSFGNKMAYQFFLRFYLINCAVNPIIYCFYNQNFRHGVKRLFESLKTTMSFR